MALTASAEVVNRERVIKLLHMHNATRVTVSPNRHNIRLGLKHVSSNTLYPHMQSCMQSKDHLGLTRQ